jgi:hypothetical protein
MNGKETQRKLDDLVFKFNIVVMGMVKHITEYYSDPKMEKVKIILDKVITGSSDKLLSYFLLHVYKNDEYRLNILKQNDKFFIDHEYDTQGNTEKLMNIFEFKRLWKQIDQDTKNYIKKSMMTLVKISQQYILTK